MKINKISKALTMVLVGVGVGLVSNIQADAYTWKGTYFSVNFNETEYVSVEDIDVPTYSTKDRDYEYTPNKLDLLGVQVENDIREAEDKLRNGEIDRIKVNSNRYKVYDRESGSIKEVSRDN